MDGVAGALAAGAAYAVRPGADRDVWGTGAYAAVAALAPVVWLAVLGTVRAHDRRRPGDGRADLRDVTVTVAALLGFVAWLAWATPVEVPRDFILLLLAVAAAGTLLGRTLLRLDLQVRRARGECVQRVLAVGRVPAVDALVRQLRRDKHNTAHVVGCCVPVLPPDDAAFYLGPVPVVGGFDDVAAALRTVGADTVAVLPCPELDAPALRRLAWALEDAVPHFVVIPGLADVAGPRLAVGPVGDLPVLHVRHARRHGLAWLLKGLLDRLAALTALLLLAPLMAVIALVVRAGSPGPALFRQTRVGLDGREFTFLKFRTMYVGAELRRAELEDNNINGDGVLFKMRDDPRITRAGRILRRWSLDELPQLLNVLSGEMSLVGPRPPLPQEVARYGPDVHRRLAVRPGLTGLWQISGRSDLSWEDAVRLDLRYVDNWSLGLDAVVLLRTLPAVLNRTGAY
ncbi:sugar transferase [Spirilliplanes yamanashiensis]|uniref:sugar transferase n=1 Tax=Spirilliplanes yamanashiensis TaxID=42233 RepID=UPI001EF39405|nr:sugar transferase [Spirilliplanes yamanashiensis]MDP9818109.1 exopolysaccharide biosynthesis polyprenyl glycosylphosphotransferase [Spirilliplanes yamanashiensis]